MLEMKETHNIYLIYLYTMTMFVLVSLSYTGLLLLSERKVGRLTVSQQAGSSMAAGALSRLRSWALRH